MYAKDVICLCMYVGEKEMQNELVEGKGGCMGSVLATEAIHPKGENCFHLITADVRYLQ